MAENDIASVSDDLERVKARYPEKAEFIDRVAGLTEANALDRQLPAKELARFCQDELGELHRKYPREAINAVAQNLDWLQPLLSELDNTQWQGESITQEKLSDMAMAGSLYNVYYAAEQMAGVNRAAAGITG